MMLTTASTPYLVLTVHTHPAPDTDGQPVQVARLFANVQAPEAPDHERAARARRDPFGIGSFRLHAAFHLGKRTWDQIKPWMAPLLESYVRDGGPGEDRAEARRRIEAAIEAGPDGTLVLAGLGLRSLPPVLPDVALLDVSDNRLTALPVLPCSLQMLDASRNALVMLPALPAGLRGLNVADNQLGRLSQPLPDGLAMIDASRNALVDLPVASSALATLRVDGNRGQDLDDLAARRLREADMLRSVYGPSTYTGLRRRLASSDCVAHRFEEQLVQVWNAIKDR